MTIVPPADGVKPELKLISEENPRCARCDSTDLAPVKQMFVKRRQAMVQIYLCRSCGSQHTAATWNKYSAPEATIRYAISLKRRGYTTNEIVEACRKRDNTTGYSYHTIINWVHTFAPDLKLRNGSGSDARAMAAAIRKLVGVETLAREMHVSPTKVERLLANIDEYTKSPLSVKLRYEARVAGRLARDLVLLAERAEKLQGRLQKKGKATRDKNKFWK